MKGQEKKVNRKTTTTEKRFGLLSASCQRLLEHINSIIFTIISNMIKTLKFLLQEVFLFQEIGEW